MSRISFIRRGFVLLLAACLMLSATACDGVIGEVEQKNDELVIWKQSTGVPLENAFQGFQALHSEISVKVEDYTQMPSGEFSQKLASEINAGHGPDIIITDFTLQRSASVEKMMQSGVFADMTEYFTDFDWENYSKPVMDAGVVDGKRYLFPTQYTMPMLLSSRSVLDESGFRVENCTDYVSFLQEYGRYRESHPDGAYNLFDYSYTLEPFFCGIGNLSWMNYKQKKADLSSPELKAAVEAYLPLYAEEQTTETVDSKIKVGKEREDGFLFRTYFAANHQMNWRSTFITDLLQKTAAEEKGVFLPIRNKDGGISVHIKEAMGVRNNSANKELASEFIKYLLSDNLQLSKDDRLYWPVSISACRGLINQYKQSTGTLSVMDEDGHMISGLTDEDADAIFALTGEIDSAYFRSPYDEEFYDAFRPYWEGNSSYEECTAAFEKRAQILISE